MHYDHVSTHFTRHEQPGCVPTALGVSCRSDGTHGAVIIVDGSAGHNQALIPSTWASIAKLCYFCFTALTSVS